MPQPGRFVWQGSTAAVNDRTEKFYEHSADLAYVSPWPSAGRALNLGAVRKLPRNFRLWRRQFHSQRHVALVAEHAQLGRLVVVPGRQLLA